MAAALLMGNAAGERPRLTFQGLGEIRIGMSEPELLAMGFSDGREGVDEDLEFASCHYLTNDADWPEIHLMINDGRLVRIDTSYSGTPGLWSSLSGATTGMTEAEVRSIYGDWIKTSPHPYLGEAGSYLTLASGDGRHAMIFETASDEESGERRVTDFRAGLEGPVGFIEGCA